MSEKWREELFRAEWDGFHLHRVTVTADGAEADFYAEEDGERTITGRCEDKPGQVAEAIVAAILDGIREARESVDGR